MRSASPGPPPEEWLGIDLSVPLEVRPHARWVRFLASSMSPRRLTEPPRTCGIEGTQGNSGGGRFSKRSASPGPPPEEWLGISLSVPLEVRPHARWVRFPVYCAWSRRLTEPP